jgi:DNA-binding NarL/FixJ family response regulator
MSPRKLDRQRFRDLYDAGQGDIEIAEALGVARNTVQSHRENLGLPTNGRNPTFAWTRARVAVLRSMAAEGATAREIAEALGATAHSVYHAARHHGVSLPRAERRPAFSPSEDQAIIDGVLAGQRKKDIAADLCRTPTSVSCRIRRLRAAGRLPAVRTKIAIAAPVLPPVPEASRCLTAVPDPVRACGAEPAEDRLARLSARFGPQLVARVVAIGRGRGSYRKLADLAEASAVPIRTVEMVWHQVAA